MPLKPALGDAYRNIVVTTGTASGGVPGTTTARAVDAQFNLDAGYGISLIADPLNNKVTVVNTGNGTGALTTITENNSNGNYYPIFTRGPTTTLTFTTGASDYVSATRPAGVAELRITGTSNSPTGVVYELRTGLAGLLPGETFQAVRTLDTATINFTVGTASPINGIPQSSATYSTDTGYWTVVLAGSVGVITVTSAGTGYTIEPAVIFSAPDIASGVQATGTATISNGTVTGIIVTNVGSGYSTAPIITIAPPLSGNIATATCKTTAETDVAETYSSITIPTGVGDINPVTGTYQMDTMYLDQTTTPMTYNPSTGTLTVSNLSSDILIANRALIGPPANFIDWPNATLVSSQADTGHTHDYNFGMVGEATGSVGDSAIWGVGVYGRGNTNTASSGTGVLGDGGVTDTTNVQPAIGVRGYANDIHAGGRNIGLYGSASNSGVRNLALLMAAGDIESSTAQTWYLNGNLAFNGNYSVSFSGDVVGQATQNVFNTTSTTVNAFNAATTLALGNAATTLSIGNTATAAQTVNMFTASTGSSTYNFATGATTSGNTKAINIGTNGLSGSATNIVVGSSISGNTTTVTLNGTVKLTSTGSLRFTATGGGATYVGFQAPATIASNLTWTLPSADATTAGFALVSNGSGVLSWAAAGAVITNDIATTTLYPTMTTLTTGNFTDARVSSSKFSFNAATGTLAATKLSGTLDKTFTINGIAFNNSADVTATVATGPQGPAGPSTYDLFNFVNGKPLALEVLMRAITVRVYTIAANFAGCLAYCTTGATTAQTVNILKNGVTIGTITFGIASTSGVFAGSPSGVTMNIGDQLQVQMASGGSQDASFSDLAFTIKGTSS
jgi:hypothetical protein